MATRYIEKESEKVSDSVSFKWKIKNFTVDDLPDDEKHIKSSSFQCLNAVFRLELYRVSDGERGSDDVYLTLTQSNKANPPWISDCTIGFTYSDECDQHFRRFTTPTKPAYIVCSFPASAILEHSADSVLNVCCNFTASALEQVDHESESESDEWESGADLSETELDESEIESDEPETDSVESDKKPDESEKESDDPSLKLRIMNNLVEDIGKALEHCSLSDVTLKVEGEEFQAHKIILASRSKVFHAMFENDMKESQKNVIDILEMQPSIAKQMLLYIYSGEIEQLSMDRALDLYVAADRYDLQELKGCCKRFIQKHISPKDVCRVAEFADLHNDKKLAKTVRRVFKEQSKIILVSKEWRDFAEKNLVLYSSLMEGALLNES